MSWLHDRGTVGECFKDEETFGVAISCRNGQHIDGLQEVDLFVTIYLASVVENFSQAELINLPLDVLEVSFVAFAQVARDMQP